MEINGIKVDKKYLSNLSIKFSQRIEKLEKKYTKKQVQNLTLVLQNNYQRSFLIN